MSSFTDVDLEEVQIPNDDVLVITAKIDENIAQRMLVDTSSSCDALFLFALGQVDISHTYNEVVVKI